MTIRIIFCLKNCKLPSGLNSQYFPTIGKRQKSNSRGLDTHSKDDGTATQFACPCVAFSTTTRQENFIVNNVPKVEELAPRHSKEFVVSDSRYCRRYAPILVKNGVGAAL